MHLSHFIVEFPDNYFFPTMIRCLQPLYANINNLRIAHAS